MTLPRTWSWDDRDGRTHMVTEATPIEAGTGAQPHLRTLCGATVPVGWRTHGTRQCDVCHEHLTALIEAAFERMGQPAARA
jgi:hypothetical protein